MSILSHTRLPPWIAALGALLYAGAGWAQGTCPGSAAVTVFVENLSSESSVDITVDGEVASSVCAGTGASSYRQTMTCVGSGVVRCGQVRGLQAGRWVHRLMVSISDSAPQQQAQTLVVLAGNPAEVSNALIWTIYPRTFVVGEPTAAALQWAIDQAESYSNEAGGPALVTFAPDTFPGASAPQTIPLLPAKCEAGDRNHCRPGGIADKNAGLCFTGSRIVVDALDRNAAPGGVILSVGTCAIRGLLLYGSDNVLRGLTVLGSRKWQPTLQADAVVLGGVPDRGIVARRNRLEQLLVVGPTKGDAVSDENGAGQPDDDGAGENLIVDSRITGATDKGVKVDYGGYASVARTCVHDNDNGGIQSTLGGHVLATENVVQHNVPGQAENGLSVRGTDDRRSTLVTQGNIVRLSGGRGLSVTDNAEATFQNDYVADSQFAGSVVETTPRVPVAMVDGSPIDLVAKARFRGVALVCNRHEGLTRKCSPSPGDIETACISVDDCCANADGTVDDACKASTQCILGSFPQGFGAVTTAADGHAAPDVSYGDVLEAGRNAFTTNKNTSRGANFLVTNVATVVPAEWNQWEHCGTGSVCDVASVQANDVVPADVLVDLGAPPGARAGTPVLYRVTPARPRAGDVVRIYGDNFNAIEGNPLPIGGTRNCADLPACASDGTCPEGPCVDGLCPCSITNPAVQLQNQQTTATRVRIKAQDGTVLRTLYPDAVTPTMLAFHMPFDCFAPLIVEVAKRGPSGDRLVSTVTFCDPKGCADKPEGSPCDDGDACTSDNRCDGNGNCVGSSPPICDGACLTCDTPAGCVPRPANTACSDNDACTTGDHCSGIGNDCLPGTPVACTGVCQTGLCDPKSGCEPSGATVCRPAADSCDLEERCDGLSNHCPSNVGKTGPDATTCAFDRGLPDACAGQPEAWRMWRLFRKAGEIVTRAEGATGAKRLRLLRKADALLKREGARIDHALRPPRQRLAQRCADALRGMLSDTLPRVERQLDQPGE